MLEADKAGASYVLAQDPDADRFAAAEKQYVDYFPPGGSGYLSWLR